MSKPSNTAGRTPFQRATTAVIVGIIAFAAVKLGTDGGLQLPAGIGAGILAWLVTAPPRTEEKKK